MIKKITALTVAVLVGVFVYVKGYNDGLEYGYLNGFFHGLKKGRIKELVNQGHTVTDAIYIINNRNMSSEITDDELE